MKKLLLVLLAAHFAIAVLRIVPRHWGRRLQQIEEYHELGRIRFFLGHDDTSNADVVQWLVENTPEQCIVLWRGEWKGPMELVPALLWPRLLYHEELAPREATRLHERRIATRESDGGNAEILVLIAENGRLRLEAR